RIEKRVRWRRCVCRGRVVAQPLSAETGEMIALRRVLEGLGRRRSLARSARLLGPLAVLFLSGCMLFQREMPRPGHTKLDSPLVIVPAVTLSNYLVVQT